MPRVKDDKTKRGPHVNAHHPVKGSTAAEAVSPAEHTPVMHRPAVPRSLRKRTYPGR